MMRTYFRLFATAAVGTAALVSTAPARADLITYSTVGTFLGGDLAGTNTYLDAADGVLIRFNGVVSNTVNVPPDTTASLGTFNTTGTTATSLQGISSGFRLDIFQTAPAGGLGTFVGSLTGSLAVNNSQAFVQFNAPLSTSIGLVLYQIIEADGGVLGRANIVPPTVNSGVSSVEANVSLIPEPSTAVLAGLGIPALLAYGALRKRRAATV